MSINEGAVHATTMRCPTLAELPRGPIGKTGWPWTAETPQLPPLQANGTPWPRISIVTPSYNQATFIEETIRSVLLQGYPNLEYIIIDGGSSDESVEIIKKYEAWLTYWVSERDDGQTDAINKGMTHATGAYLNWLNSDDLLLPRCCEYVARISTMTASPWVVSGARFLSDVLGNVYFAQNFWKDSWPSYRFGIPHFPQDASFFSREAWRRCGPLDTRMQFVFDVAFFYLIVKNTSHMAFTSIPLSKMHVYATIKTLRKDDRKGYEIKLLEREYMSVTGKVIERLFRTRFHRFVLAALTCFAPKTSNFVVEFDASTDSLMFSCLD